MDFFFPSGSSQSQSVARKKPRLQVDETGDTITPDKDHLVDDDGNVSKVEESKPSEREPVAQEHVYVREKICGFDGLKFIIVGSLLFAVFITVGMVINIVFGPPQIQPYGAVATDASQCSQVGLEILEDGGSAVDAGIAAMLCLGVVHPHASGLGGGGFLIVGNPKTQQQAAYNFREMSPEYTNQEMFKGNRDLATKGGLAVAVPGEINGFRLAWENHGILPWDRLFTGAIRLAKFGFEVTEAFEEAVRRVNLNDFPEDMRELLAPRGVKVNHTQEALIYRQTYASLLQTLAQSKDPSVESFGNGIIATVEENGGNISYTDISNYTALPMNISTTTFYNQDVLTTYAPSNGPLVLMLMNIMQDYNYTSLNESEPLYFHRFLEALKFSEAYATNLGDPDASKQVKKSVEEMLSDVTANKLRGKINASSVLDPTEYFKDGRVQTPVSSYGGAQVLVMSSDGTMVSISSSINTPFGARLMTQDGVILNNAMDNFDWVGKSGEKGPSIANMLGPNKRPQSDLAPLLSWNASNFCTRRFALGGSSGISDKTLGSRCSAGVAQVTLRLLMGHNLTTAISPEERVFNGLVPDRLEIEDGLQNETIAYLKNIYSDKVFKESAGLNIVHGLMKEKDALYAQADSRRLGAKAVKYGRP